MKTLRDYVVTNALFQADTGPEAQVGDQIRLYLDTEANPGFPEYVVGVIQHPISKVNCGSATSYVVEYDEADLDGAAALLRPQDVIDAVVVTATEVLDAALTAHIAARIAADATKQPLDSDLTSYAGAADAAARRALIGAAAKAEIVFYDPAITGLTGGGSTNLDGIVTVGVDVGRIQAVFSGSYILWYILKSGNPTETGNTVVKSDDQPTTRYWELLPLSVKDFTAYGGASIKGTLFVGDDEGSPTVGGVISLYDNVAGLGNTFEVIDGAVKITGPNGSISLTIPAFAGSFSLPFTNGRLSLIPIVTAATPLTGGSVTGAAYVDETHYVTPAGTIAALTWNLPTAANSQVGQIKTFFSTQAVTTLTVTVSGGGTKVGTALTAAVANEAYSYQCVSTSGAGTWIRLS